MVLSEPVVPGSSWKNLEILVEFHLGCWRFFHEEIPVTQLWILHSGANWNKNNQTFFKAQQGFYKCFHQGRLDGFQTNVFWPKDSAPIFFWWFCRFFIFVSFSLRIESKSSRLEKKFQADCCFEKIIQGQFFSPSFGFDSGKRKSSRVIVAVVPLSWRCDNLSLWQMVDLIEDLWTCGPVDNSTPTPPTSIKPFLELGH